MPANPAPKRQPKEDETLISIVGLTGNEKVSGVAQIGLSADWVSAQGTGSGGVEEAMKEVV